MNSDLTYLLRRLPPLSLNAMKWETNGTEESSCAPPPHTHTRPSPQPSTSPSLAIRCSVEAVNRRRICLPSSLSDGAPRLQRAPSSSLTQRVHFTSFSLIRMCRYTKKEKEKKNTHTQLTRCNPPSPAHRVSASVFSHNGTRMCTCVCKPQCDARHLIIDRKGEKERRAAWIPFFLFFFLFSGCWRRAQAPLHGRLSQLHHITYIITNCNCLSNSGGISFRAWFERKKDMN